MSKNRLHLRQRRNRCSHNSSQLLRRKKLSLPIRKFFTAALLGFAVFSSAASAREMESFPVVKLQSLDKITARTMTFEADVGNTIKFGSLYIKIQACKKAPPVEAPESAAFLQVWEVKPGAEKNKEEPEWVFSGWMFSSSPALSHMDHPIYDVWVLDCLNSKDEAQQQEQKKSPDALEGEGEIKANEAPAEPAIETEVLSPLGD